MITGNEMLYLRIVMIIASAIVGLAIGVWIGRHNTNAYNKPLGKLFVERIDAEPYVTGCWLGIENQDDIKNLKRDGQVVTFVVSINHHSAE